MSTGFLVSSRWLKFAASSVTPTQWSSRSAVVEKNALWCLRPCLSHLLRSASQACARSVLWRQAGLLGVLDSPGLVLPVPRCEARGTGVVGRQPALHQAVCFLRRPTLPGKHHSGCDRG